MPLWVHSENGGCENSQPPFSLWGEHTDNPPKSPFEKGDFNIHMKKITCTYRWGGEIFRHNGVKSKDKKWDVTYASELVSESLDLALKLLAEAFVDTCKIVVHRE